MPGMVVTPYLAGLTANKASSSAVKDPDEELVAEPAALEDGNATS